MNLSNLLIQKAASLKAKTILNFGCCYLRLKENEFPLSSFAKQIGFYLSFHGLSLATRGYESMSYEDFLLKWRIKEIRYSFHLLLYHKLDPNLHRTVLLRCQLLNLSLIH